MSYRDPAPKPVPSRLLPAVIVIGGLAAIAVGVLIAMAVSRPNEVAGGSPEPEPSVGPHASGPASTPTLAPTSDAHATPTPVSVVTIPNRGIAVVTAAGEGLHLREAGNRSSASLGTLSSGARLFVIGAPVANEGYRWYRVAWVDGPLKSGCVDACPRIGWVATPPSGEPWLEEADVACGTPTTIQDLDALLPLERLSCFGAQDIVLTGPVEHYGVTGCRPELSPVYRPAWLVGRACGFGVQFAGTETFIRFTISPESGLEEPPAPAGIRFTGHFEDPAAPSCRLVEPGDGIGALSGAALVLHCRTILVITDYEVIALP